LQGEEEQILKKTAYRHRIGFILSLVGIMAVAGCSSSSVSKGNTSESSGTLLKVKKVSAATLDQNENGPSQFTADVPAGKLIATIPYPKHANTVYLTFDDGPGDYTKEIVDILDKNHIKGSFFWVGDNVANWMTKDPAHVDFSHYMLKDGDVIGSHTMKHTALGHKSLNEQIHLIEESTQFVSEKIGHQVDYFRPPYGSVDKNTRKASIATKQILTYWDADSEDWKYPNDPQKVTSNIMKEVKPGAIILMHEKSHTVLLLQQVIDELKAKGYQFAPLPIPKGKV
jgi:peptidoglycan-N-acetylglucosamine deacetylase